MSLKNNPYDQGADDVVREIEVSLEILIEDNEKESDDWKNGVSSAIAIVKSIRHELYH